MGVLVAGEGGTALFVAASLDATDVVVACEGLRGAVDGPGGIRVVPVDAPPADGIDRVLLAAGEPETRRRMRDWASSRGIGCSEAVLDPLEVPGSTRVIAVASPRTGSGKTALTRRIARGLRRSGASVAVARHPIAALAEWEGGAEAVLATPTEGLGRPGPLCEREELGPVLEAGVPVATGLDHRGVLEAAAGAAAGDRAVVVWDGGGSAPPWVTPDFTFVVVDALRPPTEESGMLIGAADAVVITKADTAPEDNVREAEAVVRSQNPDAPVVLADIPPQVPDGPKLLGSSVVCVEDAPSLLLGGLRGGAASVAARRFRCGVVDPRPFAVGALAEVLEAHPHLKGVVPTLGRTREEMRSFTRTIAATPGEAILWGSSAPPQGLVAQGRPVFRVLSELMEVAGPTIQELLTDFLPGT